jgi:NADPH2 dehydrogenase
MSALFAPLTLRGVTFPNRIAVSPMCQYCVTDGFPAEWHAMHLLQLAVSGAGMLTIESTAVEAAGRITPGDLGLWDDAHQAAFEPILAAIRKHSNIPVTLQLAHAGRKASSDLPWMGGHLLEPEDGGWPIFAPSAIPHKEHERLPTALDESGLQRIRSAFVAAARRAADLGFDCLELHGGHGYLIHQFLSPIANQRTDQYGGSIENRFRFPLEVFEAVRAVFPQERPVGIKLSATDWVKDGWDLEQTVAFARELKRRGVDWVVASSGGISPLQQISVRPGYQVPFAQTIRQQSGLLTGAVGLITDPVQAETIVATGQADFVAVGRAMLYDPRWPWHAAAVLGAKVQAPPQYWRAPPHAHKDIFGSVPYGAR